MKKKFLDSSITRISKKYPNYDSDKLEIISYGLEALYVLFSKTLVIFFLAFIFGIFYEVLLIFVLYGIIRTTAFGMHAEKSSHCYIISITLFIGAAILCKYIDFNYYIRLLLAVTSLVVLIKYSPADTCKRPLINKKKRNLYKIITIVNSCIYVLLIIILKDNSLSNYFVMGLLDASLMIHPLTYRVFQLPYNNYKKYEDSYI